MTAKQVLQSMQKNELKMNKRKCIFNATTLKLLRHIITLDGIEPNSEKIKAIKIIYFWIW